MCGSGSTKVLNTDPIRIRIDNTGFLQSLFSPQLYSRVTWAVLPGVVHWSIPNGSGDLTGVPNGLVVPTWMNSHLKWLYVCPLGNKNKKLSLWPYFIMEWNFYYLSILFETSDSFKSNCPPPFPAGPGVWIFRARVLSRVLLFLGTDPREFYQNMCRWFLKDKILKSFCSNLIKIKSFSVRSEPACLYATEYMGSDVPFSISFYVTPTLYLAFFSLTCP